MSRLLTTTPWECSALDLQRGGQTRSSEPVMPSPVRFVRFVFQVLFPPLIWFGVDLDKIMFKVSFLAFPIVRFAERWGKLWYPRLLHAIWKSWFWSSFLRRLAGILKKQLLVSTPYRMFSSEKSKSWRLQNLTLASWWRYVYNSHTTFPSFLELVFQCLSITVNSLNSLLTFLIILFRFMVTTMKIQVWR